MPDHASLDVAQRTAVVNQLDYLWNEYAYRHGLCWSAVYKITSAAVVLGALPYAKDALTRELQYLMLIPVWLGVALIVFGIALVRNELAEFGRTKLAYRTLQKTFIEFAIEDTETRRKVLHRSRPTEGVWFPIFVYLFLAALFIVSVGNAVFLSVHWVEHLVASPP